MKSRQSIAGTLTAGVLLLALSIVLLTEHFTMLQDVRSAVLPLAGDVALLEHRAEVLAQQQELMEAKQSLESGSPEEQLRAYVLPQDMDLQRLMGLLDATQSLLHNARMGKSFSAIELGEQSQVRLHDVPLTRQPFTFAATVTEEGAAKLLSLFELTGLLTVGDALTREEIDHLFALTEAQNYAGITDIEQFLSTDLLSYVRDPRPAEDRLFKAFSSEEFLQSFRALLRTSRVGTAKELLGGTWGAALVRNRVWPGPIVVLDSITQDDASAGWVTLTLELSAYGRGAM